MRLARGVDDQRRALALQAAARQGKGARPFARADQRDQGPGRGRVLDDAAPAVAQAYELTHPIDDDLFELGQRRARLPRQAERAEACREIVAEHGRELAVAGEVAEEAR